MRKRPENPLKTWGYFNMISPIPTIFFSAFWAILVNAFFGFDDTSAAATVISAIPLFICPVSCIGGFLFSLRQLTVRKPEALRCMLSSLAGLAEMILLWGFLAFLSSVD